MQGLGKEEMKTTTTTENDTKHFHRGNVNIFYRRKENTIQLILHKNIKPL